MNLMGPLLIVVGIFSICGAGFDWDWFMISRKARFLVNTIGRNGARAFYGLLGAALAVMGALIACGIIQNARILR